MPYNTQKGNFNYWIAQNTHCNFWKMWNKLIFGKRTLFILFLKNVILRRFLCKNHVFPCFSEKNVILRRFWRKNHVFWTFSEKTWFYEVFWRKITFFQHFLKNVILRGFLGKNHVFSTFSEKTWFYEVFWAKITFFQLFLKKRYYSPENLEMDNLWNFKDK